MKEERLREENTSEDTMDEIIGKFVNSVTLELEEHLKEYILNDKMEEEKEATMKVEFKLYDKKSKEIELEYKNTLGINNKILKYFIS